MNLCPYQLLAGARILGLPIRECADRLNNCVPRCPKLSAINETGKANLSVCILCWRIDGKICHHAIGAHTPTAHSATISRFLCNIPKNFFSTIYMHYALFMSHLAESWSGHWGVGGEPKIVAKRDPSASNSAWESIFQINMDFRFTAWRLGFLNMSEYLARFGIEISQSVIGSHEDEFRNDRRNANRNPDWWGDFSQLVEIEKLKF